MKDRQLLIPCPPMDPEILRALHDARGEVLAAVAIPADVANAPPQHVSAVALKAHELVLGPGRVFFKPVGEPRWLYLGTTDGTIASRRRSKRFERWLRTSRNRYFALVASSSSRPRRVRCGGKIRRLRPRGWVGRFAP